MTDKTILVPLDGSRFAESAIPAALGAARTLGARVELITVVESDSIIGGSKFNTRKFKFWLSEYLDDIINRIAKVSDVPVFSTIADGFPPHELVDHSKRAQVDLIALATHGLGPRNRAWLGSVADWVVHHVDVPVLLIRAEEEEERPDLTERQFRKILVALDGSTRAEQSLEWSVRMAKSAEASLALVRVVEPPAPFSSPYLPHTVGDTRAALAEGCRVSEAYLDKVKQQLRGEGSHVESETLAGVPPAQGILDYADEHEVDLIAIATHGRGSLSRVLLGSVADKVARAANMPVLIVRPSKSSATRS